MVGNKKRVFSSLGYYYEFRLGAQQEEKEKAAAAKAQASKQSLFFSCAYFLSTMIFDDKFAKEHINRWTKAE
jgi:hypothetical protein